MNCKGCIHCQYIGRSSDDFLGISFHYCDLYPEKDSIGDAYKWCEGKSYENQETNNFRQYLER